MPEERPSAETIEVDLRQPWAAAFWAWLWPGAGHLYQRRYAKGILFMTCIICTYFFGLAIGGGRVVYASWVKHDRRWQYFCQVGVGLPALPAIVQNMRARDPNRQPFFNGFMAPPKDVHPVEEDQLAEWHKEYHTYFELGTLYTMIAGLLNILAVYDAFGGPFVPPPDNKKNKSPPKKAKRKKSDSGESNQEES